jgi:hypothetical protein
MDNDGPFPLGEGMGLFFWSILRKSEEIPTNIRFQDPLDAYI